MFFVGPLIATAGVIDLLALLSRANWLVILGLALSAVTVVVAIGAHLLQRRLRQSDKGIVCG